MKPCPTPSGWSAMPALRMPVPSGSGSLAQSREEVVFRRRRGHQAASADEVLVAKSLLGEFLLNLEEEAVGRDLSAMTCEGFHLPREIFPYVYLGSDYLVGSAERLWLEIRPLEGRGDPHAPEVLLHLQHL